MPAELLAIRKERARTLAETLAQETGVPVADILGRRRFAAVVAVRHRLWRMLRDTGMTYLDLAEVLGVDHTSVIAAVKKARRRPCDRCPAFGQWSDEGSGAWLCGPCVTAEHLRDEGDDAMGEERAERLAAWRDAG